MRSKDSGRDDDRKHAEPGRPWRKKAQGWREAVVRLAHDVRIVAGAVNAVATAVKGVVWLVRLVFQWLG
ncbi:hypothetical protein [Actinomyces wuliandei]|uniref:hypothetical protein n=1 Tax=Actinomyces wuliandei TaxID=2057743 RepID=UPI001117B361|nr:hypothetical protein [Actinomyces wuliandei]